MQCKRLVSELDSVLSNLARYRNAPASNVRGQEAVLGASLAWKPDSTSAPTSFGKQSARLLLVHWAFASS